MKIAVISGASSGIGRSFAKQLDLYGLDEIWLIARNSEKLEGISKTLSTKAVILPLDLEKEDSFDTLCKLYEAEKPSISYLVCSAGVGYSGAFESLTPDKIQAMINLNCTALTLLTSISLPYLENGSKVIEIASGAGFLPQPYFSVYASSKSYVISFSRALRAEIRKRGINVTAVCPGPVDTNFFSSLENVKEYKKKFLISPDKVAKYALKSAKKGKAISSPSLSMKLVHLVSKIVPTSLILKFYKQ
ncbi:MAG: SDR family NAD(P)-dependent oxidoreductase [Eubacteriales bacterium]